MDKKQLEGILRETFLLNDSHMGYNEIKDFIFDTIIPNIINSLPVKEVPKTKEPEMQETVECITYIINNYIKDKAKHLYGINLQPFTFITSPKKPCSPKNTKTKEKRTKERRQV